MENVIYLSYFSSRNNSLCTNQYRKQLKTIPECIMKVS